MGHRRLDCSAGAGSCSLSGRHGSRSEYVGYSFSENFISDLGMTVAHGGQANALGASFFSAGFGLLALALVGCVFGFVRLHSASARGWQAARIGAAGAGLAAVSLLAAGLSPANIAAPLHLWSATIASAVAPPSLVFLAIAAARDGRFTSGVSIVWLVLAATVAAWFAMRWGPAVTTRAGLIVQASVQKIVAIIVVSSAIYQSHRGGLVAKVTARHSD